ncbi:hypothetical protein CVIRNUC_008481 [Coccomyxa viridis]|uniref:Uncharacterized protein n=1 Tax=Coccomyxa viridis TaxID=1274662 RepID=A0AAV1IFP1_9CHLO|nr:hypothetical protein CVIRNUC_008481 [Coccomyxa viridis]
MHPSSYRQQPSSGHEHCELTACNSKACGPELAAKPWKSNRMCSMYATLRGSKGKLHTPGFQSLEGLIVAIPQLRRTNAMLSILLCRAEGLSKEHLQPMKQPPFLSWLLAQH